MYSFLLAASLLLGRPPTSAQIDEFCLDAMRSWQAPGLAVVIVQNGQTLYLKGHGYRSLDGKSPVGPDTVFPLASCSKPFTTLAAAILVDDGTLRWDEPLRTYWPDFTLSDPLAAKECSLADVFSHRTGIGGHHLLWYRAPWDFEERLKKIGSLPFQHPFRTSFEYQTLLFGAGGKAIGLAGKDTWQSIVQKRVLDPLEMKATRTRFDPSQRDLALPHRKNAAGKVVSIERYPLLEPDPAGSMHSTARDLARFLTFQLGDGAWQGRSIVSPKNLAETHRAHSIIPNDGFVRLMNPESVQLTYGLGWIVQDYRNQRLVLHGGAIDGFRAHLVLVPEAHLGIALLNNLDRSYLNLALSQNLIDPFLNLSAKDWNSYYLDAVQTEEKAERSRRDSFLAKRELQSMPTLALEKYVGRYADSVYGHADVRIVDGRLLWKWGNIDCLLEHWYGDTFAGNNGLLVDATFAFAVKDGGVVSVRGMERNFDRIGK